MRQTQLPHLFDGFCLSADKIKQGTFVVLTRYRCSRLDKKKC